MPDTNWRIGKYEILEEIGRGGMGVIYRARQRHSRRIVALKRILSYHADSQETLKRFRREAEAASSLDHPNILPIYEVDESDDGVPFFSMKFASGGSLHDVAPALRNDPREIVRLMAKVVRAVQYAHRQGILHRDLKPGNILLDGRGEPLVSDFGLAKWLDVSSDLTRTLTIFGTPGYIAPEQAVGRAAAITPAADVYSLGAILFDLLTGRPPFLGEHALAVIRQASEKTAPKLRSLGKGFDKDLETICARCLEREPTARYRSAADLAEDLERWLEGRPIIARPISPPVRLWRWSRRNPALAGSVAAALIIGGFAIGWQIQTRRLTRTVQEDILAARSVAVLPFLNLDTAQPDLEFAQSFANALRPKFAALGPARLNVVADSTVIIPSVGDLDNLRILNTRTGCQTVLWGTIRPFGSGWRVSARLSDVETGKSLFDCVKESLKPYPAREVAAATAQVLYDVLSDSHKAASAPADPALSDPAAHELLRAGDDLASHRTAVDIDRALACYQRAIELEPKSALARTSFVSETIARAQFGSGDSKLLDRATSLGREAVALSPQAAPTHRALAALFLYVRGDVAGAREESLRAVEVGTSGEGAALMGNVERARGRPDIALRWYSIAERWQGRPGGGVSAIGDAWAELAQDDRATEMYSRMAALHPELPEGWMGLCRLNLLEQNFSTARKFYQDNQKTYSQFPYTTQIAAQVEFFSRNFVEAEKLYRTMEQTDPGGGGSFYGAVDYESALGRIRLAAGDRTEALALLHRRLEVEKQPTQNSEMLYRLAAVESCLNEIAPALQYLRAAGDAGWVDYRSLALDPRFDSIRQDARFSRISEAMATRVASLRRRGQPLSDGQLTKTTNNER
ncbi:MAG TPA: protein kinase [Chthoniobacterales bacterium]